MLSCYLIKKPEYAFCDRRYNILKKACLFFLVIFFSLSSQAVFAIPTVSWDFGTHYLGDSAIGASPVKITINDVGANTTAIDTITARVTSTSDPVGINLNLVETGNKTAIFKNTNLIFYSGDGLIPLGRTATITISDPNANTNSTIINTLAVLAKSTSSPGGLALTFQETGVNTGIFSGKITFETIHSGSSGSILNVTSGDEVTIQDVSSGLSSNALITPNSNSGFGAIKASIGDTVKVTYQGITASTVIGNDTIIPGGGGGGLIAHPGLVLDIIAALGAMGGSPYIVQPPSFGGLDYSFSDGLTFTQGDNKTTHDISHYNQELPRQVMVAGEKVNMTFKTFESYYSEGVIHMGLYLIPRGHDMITSNSISSIEWDKGKPVKIMDSNHILSNANASSSSDGKFQYTKFVFTPIKSYNKMSFLVRAWNDHLYTTDIRIHDAIDIPQIINSTLPYGIIKYDNFADLQQALYKDQFYKPEILSHIHDTGAVFPAQQGKVYWLYDIVNHFVTLVVSDKDDNELFSFKSPLQPYAIEKKGDYKFMYFTVKQLNRWDTGQIQNAMKTEEEKALSVALEKRIMPQSKW